MATSSVLARLQPFGWVVAALLGLAVLAVAVQQQFSAVVVGDPDPEAARPPRVALPYVEPYRTPSAEELALSIAVAGVSPRLDQALRFESPVAAADRPARPAPVVVAGAPPVSVYRPARWRPAIAPANAPIAAPSRAPVVAPSTAPAAAPSRRPPAVVRALPPERVVAEPFVPLTPWFVTRR